jgi:hypothetical protein
MPRAVGHPIWGKRHGGSMALSSEFTRFRAVQRMGYRRSNNANRPRMRTFRASEDFGVPFA